MPTLTQKETIKCGHLCDSLRPQFHTFIDFVTPLRLTSAPPRLDNDTTTTGYDVLQYGHEDQRADRRYLIGLLGR